MVVVVVVVVVVVGEATQTCLAVCERDHLVAGHALVGVAHELRLGQRPCGAVRARLDVPVLLHDLCEALGEPARAQHAPAHHVVRHAVHLLALALPLLREDRRRLGHVVQQRPCPHQLAVQLSWFVCMCARVSRLDIPGCAKREKEKGREGEGHWRQEANGVRFLEGVEDGQGHALHLLAVLDDVGEVVFVPQDLQALCVAWEQCHCVCVRVRQSLSRSP